MEPRAAQNGARMEEQQSLNPKKCSLAPKMLPGWFQERSGSEWTTPNRRFWGPLGDPKLTKNRPVDLQSGAGLFCLSDFYSMLRLAQFFDSIWGRFFMKKPCFFNVIFWRFSLFCQPGDPNETL